MINQQFNNQNKPKAEPVPFGVAAGETSKPKAKKMRSPYRVAGNELSSAEKAELRRRGRDSAASTRKALTKRRSSPQMKPSGV